MTDEITEDGGLVEKPKRKPKNIRNSKGQFKPGISGNPNGRSVGSKSKINSNKLTNFLNKNGIYSLDKLIEIGNRLIAKEQDVQAAKVFMFVSAEALKLMSKQLSMDMQEASKLLKDNTEDDDEEETHTAAVLSFPSFKEAK